MFYLVDKKGNELGILDTDDGVIEYYSQSEVLEFISKGINIAGVTVENCNVTFSLSNVVTNKKLADKVYLDLVKCVNHARNCDTDNVVTYVKIWYDKVWNCIVYDSDNNVLLNSTANNPAGLKYGGVVVRGIGYNAKSPNFCFIAKLTELHLANAVLNNEVCNMKGRSYGTTIRAK